MRALLIVLLITGCSIESRSTALDEAHRAAIVDSVSNRLVQFRAAVGTMQPDSITPFYVADTTLRWIEDGVVRYRSRADIAKALIDAQPFMKNPVLRYDHTEITPLAPGVASIVTDFTQKFTTPDGDLAGFAGAIIAVMVHADSGWEFKVGHTSSLPRPVSDSTDRASQ